MTLIAKTYYFLPASFHEQSYDIIAYALIAADSIIIRRKRFTLIFPTNLPMLDIVNKLFSDLPGGSLKVLQITDPHLFSAPEGTLKGVNTRLSLLNLLDETMQYRQLDLIIATGDLVHDASREGYLVFANMLEKFGIPVCCLPGNHDNSETLKSSLADGLVRYQDSFKLDDWNFIFLDSTIENSASGELATDQLDMLEHSLAEHPNSHNMICLHHNPVPVNSDWLDGMMIKNATDFFDIIDRNKQVKAVVWGHVHQEFDQTRNDVRLLATPSTCIQFGPMDRTFSLDMKPAGCRWMALQPNGDIRTAVTRLKYLPDGLDNTNNNYD